MQWYVIYTQQNSEQKMVNFLYSFIENNALNYEVYLPMRMIKKQWSDRIKCKLEPLFKNYIFIKHCENAFHKIKTMPGFNSYVKFGKYPTTLKETEMTLIKKIVDNEYNIKSLSSEVMIGDKVKIREGVISGLEGTLVGENNKNGNIAIMVEGLKQSIVVNVDKGSYTKIV